MTGGADAVLQNGTVYSYNLAGNYAANGNLLGYTDSMMGTWAFGYDNMNRLMTGASSSGVFAGDADCFSYDSFGNRLSGTFSANPCPATPLSIPSPANNRISGLGYSASGNVTGGDGNYYLYDSENRVCAIRGAYGGGLTGYIYDAEGARVAKGTLSSFACPNAGNFTPTTEFLLGPGGEQVTELTVSGAAVNWDHSNVYAAGKLLATYDSAGVHFQLSDWLGSKRVQTNAAGVPDETCTSLPFGDNLNCSGTDPSHLHFTGKERDAESGLDYFGARYLSSNMGRFMSPDWAVKAEPVPYAKLDNPQSLNLYGYVQNNPLTRFDADGHAIHVNISDETLMLAGAAAQQQDYDKAQPQKPGYEPPSNGQKPEGNPGQPVDANGKPLPPPVPVPGSPDSGWVFNPNPQDSRLGQWGPGGWKGPNPPSGSFDTVGGNPHWDIKPGKGEPVQHYTPGGQPISPETAHPGNPPTRMSMPTPSVGAKIANGLMWVGVAIVVVAITAVREVTQ